MDLGDFTAAVVDSEQAEADTFTFHGQSFALADRVGLMPMMRFAAAASTGIGTDNMQAMAAMHDFVRDMLADEDWPRFQQTCSRARVDAEELLALIRRIMEAMSGRPTRRRSASSDGPLATTRTSKDDYSSVKARLGLVPVNDLLSSSA